MRITGGQLRGRTFDALPGDATRPTTDRVREALFSSLNARFDFDGADVLDVFAGSGALGFEALSRGAAACTFVEKHGGTLRQLRTNAAKLGVAEACAFVKADALALPPHLSARPFSLVLADPPYALPALATLPDRLTPLLAPEGWLVLEHDPTHAFDDHALFVQARRYGRTVVSMFARGVG